MKPYYNTLGQPVRMEISIGALDLDVWGGYNILHNL